MAVFALLRGLPWRLISYIALIVALLGTGWYLKGKIEQVHDLESQLAAQEAQNKALLAQKAKADLTLQAAVKAAQKARGAATDAKRKLRNANTPADTDWKSTRLPDGVRDSLK